MNKPTTSDSQLLHLRITVVDPPEGVQFRMQRGRDHLEEPSRVSHGAISFDFAVRIGTPLADGRPNFLGEFAQGTPQDRFVYVNSGTLAGQEDSCWERRAKVKLASIDSRLLLQAQKMASVIEAKIAGTAKDGGPLCATVPFLGNGWHLVPNQT